jgi:hypothetical protein
MKAPQQPEPPPAGRRRLSTTAARAFECVWICLRGMMEPETMEPETMEPETMEPETREPETQPSMHALHGMHAGAGV